VAADPLPVDPVLLAKTARRLFNEDDLRPSVVMAQAAIDVATERTLVAAFAARGVPELTESVLSLFKGGFSLAKGGLYGVYQALTRDGLKQDTQLWGKFREHVLRRQRHRPCWQKNLRSRCRALGSRRGGDAAASREGRSASAGIQNQNLLTVPRPRRIGTYRVWEVHPSRATPLLVRSVVLPACYPIERTEQNRRNLLSLGIVESDGSNWHSLQSHPGGRRFESG
jgi:hypothetical protein